MSTVVILTGLPGTGKSTLAPGLAGRLGIPLISKDDIKETLADTLGSGDRQVSKRLGRAAFAVQFRLLERILESNRSVIAETYFHGAMAADAFSRLAATTGCTLVQVVLHCSTDAWRQRFVERAARKARHPIHSDAAALTEIDALLQNGEYRGVDLDCPTMLVEADDPHGIDIDSICRFLREHL